MKKTVALVLGVSCLFAGFAVAGPEAVSARLEKESVVVTMGGKLFTQYKFVNEFGKKPYFWPLAGPVSGQSVTTESSEPYPHHNSMWFGCDHINGADFWHHQNPKGKQVSQGPKLLEASGERVVFEDVCDWQPDTGKPVMRDFRRITISAPDRKTRIVDFDIVWVALEKVRITKTNHSLFALRMIPELSVKGGGTMLNAEGGSGEKGTFSNASPWMDYFGTRNGVTEGAAILQHPSNRWFPSPWFTRDYGFFSATPMYWLDKGYMEFAAGEALELSYRVVIHEGDVKAAGIANRYATYSAHNPAQVAGYLNSILDEQVTAVAGYTFGQSRQNLMATERLVQRVAMDPVWMAAVEARLLTLLSGCDTTADAKRFICRQLSLVGGAASVPVLSDLLVSSDLHLAEMAVFALARIADESAGTALLKGLPSVEGTVKSGLVTALGRRGDERAVTVLDDIARGEDRELSQVALSALGRLGGVQAAKKLLALWKIDSVDKTDVTDALFVAMPSLSGNTEFAGTVCHTLYTGTTDLRIRLAALRAAVVSGSETGMTLLQGALTGSDRELRKGAISILSTLHRSDIAPLAAGLLAEVTVAEQVSLLVIIEMSGDRGTAPQVRKAARSSDQAVRDAAHRALARVGDASDVELLWSRIKSDPSAFYALSGLEGAGVNEALVAALKRDDSERRLLLVKAMSERGDRALAVSLLGLVDDHDRKTRREALKGLGRIGGDETIRELIAKLNTEIESASDRKAVESCVAVIAQRLAGERGASRFIEAGLLRSNDTGKISLFRILGRLQEEAALQILDLATRNSLEAIRDVAIRALADWPRESALPLLLVVAEKTDNLTHHVLALRGTIRLLKSSARPLDELAPLYDAGRAVARREEERKMLTLNGVVLKDFMAISKGKSKIHVGGMAVGARWATDRDYTFEAVPTSILGATYIETCMDDRSVSGDKYMTFRVDVPVDVTVAYDSRCRKVPAWLAAWTRLDEAIKPPQKTGCKLNLYRKSFAAGSIELGGCAAPGASAMYSVAITEKGK